MSSNNSKKSRQVVYGAVFIALVYVCTAFIFFPLTFILPGKGGLVHFGNVPLFIIAIIFGKKYGAIAGGVGMALFDLLSGWTVWAPFTLVIVGLMGFTVGLIAHKKSTFKTNLLAIIAAGAIKVIGYYFAEVIIYGNWITPFGSIFGNLVQICVAAIIVLPLVGRIRGATARIDI